MKIKTLTMSRKKTQDYQSRGAEVTLEIGPGDTYRGAVHAGKVLLAVALGEAPDEAEVARAKTLLERAHTVDLVEVALTGTPPSCSRLTACGNYGGEKRHAPECAAVGGSAQSPKRRGRPPKSAQAGK